MLLKLLISRWESLPIHWEPFIGNNINTQVLMPAEFEQSGFVELINQFEQETHRERQVELADRIINCALSSNGLQENDDQDDPTPQFVLIDPNLPYFKFELLKQGFIASCVFVIELDNNLFPILDDERLHIIRDRQAEWWRDQKA